MDFLGLFKPDNMQIYSIIASIAIIFMTWRIRFNKKLKEKERKPPSCLISQLPTELVRHISKELSPASRRALSETCRTFRDIIGPVKVGYFKRDDCCEYLAAIARSRPDRWVCEVCIKLHKVDPDDTPIKPCAHTCPKGAGRWRFAGYEEADRLDGRLIRIDHRHIQLALKYKRLKHESYQEHLDKLIEPYFQPNFQTHIWPYRQENVLLAHYSAIPKIVMGHDGNLRQLLLSIWSYKADKKPISLAALGELRVCQHLRLAYGSNRRADPGRGSLRDVLQNFIDGESNATSGMFYCRHCPTDVFIMRSPGRLLLSAWQDLGLEGSPMDKCWRVHVSTVLRDRPVSLSHEAGSVAALYNKKWSDRDSMMDWCYRR